MSAESQVLPVVFCWHMHQPDYRGPDHHSFGLPWVYLHAIKDYSDMVAHLEGCPRARVVVNFAPTLLEQIAEYVDQLQRWERNPRRTLGDPLLAALSGQLPTDPGRREGLMRACLKANEDNLIRRHEPYRRLAEIVRWVGQQAGAFAYLNDQFLTDLLVWYHLAWMGESIRLANPLIGELELKKSDYTVADCARLLTLIREVLEGLIPRYRALAESGQVELSVTPYAHPIVPLLLDIKSGRQSLPNSSIPQVESYPGGEERARWHIQQGLKTFKRYFGFEPKGCWPSEGAVSDGSIRLLERSGIQWSASGQNVLANSLKAAYGDALPESWPHAAYQVAGGRMRCFFRDDGLSDLIGFTYSKWHADDAVADLANHMVRIEQVTRGQPGRVVSIIMDGENAWEYFPRNGYHFLSALYKVLSSHPNVCLTTFSDWLSACPDACHPIDHLVAGSWVYGTLSTWIGDPYKNRAWEMLVEAKQTYDRVVADRPFKKAELKELEFQLAHCEGSDWFWWFGDYNPGEAVADFELLFRQQLQKLYRMLGEDAPAYLQDVFVKGQGDPAMGGVMRKN